MHWSDFIQFIMVAAAIKATTGLIASVIVEPRAKCKQFYGKNFCSQMELSNLGFTSSAIEALTLMSTEILRAF